jgi:hypothetical protein
MPEKTLPFPRGDTRSYRELVTVDDTTFSDIEGRLYEVPDTVHGTGMPVILRVVKNDESADITISTAKKILRTFSTTSVTDWGRRCSGAAGAGAVCKPIDDYYAETSGLTTIPDNDLYYVVEEGPCYVYSDTTQAPAITAGQAVASDSAGACTAALAGNAVLGTAMESETLTNTKFVVMVKAGIQDSDTAG